jgi:hypothetical protein
MSSRFFEESLMQLRQEVTRSRPISPRRSRVHPKSVVGVDRAPAWAAVFELRSASHPIAAKASALLNLLAPIRALAAPASEVTD